MKCREEQLDVLEKRYNVCHKERDELNEKLIESEKFHGTVMGILNEMVDEWDENDPQETSHKEEMNRVVDAMKRETVGMRGKMDCRWLHWVIV